MTLILVNNNSDSIEFYADKISSYGSEVIMNKTKKIHDSEHVIIGTAGVADSTFDEVLSNFDWEEQNSLSEFKLYILEQYDSDVISPGSYSVILYVKPLDVLLHIDLDTNYICEATKTVSVFCQINVVHDQFLSIGSGSHYAKFATELGITDPTKIFEATHKVLPNIGTEYHTIGYNKKG